MAVIERRCTKCDAVFLAKPWEVERGGGKFCSRNCQRSYQALVNAKAMKSQLTLPEMRKLWKERTPPEVHKAHNMVEQALITGKLVRKPCEVCGEPRTDAHHDDYAKPLDVRWLCRHHHLMHHRAQKTTKQGANDDTRRS